MGDIHRVLNLLLPYLCERRRADARQMILEIEHRLELRENRRLALEED